MTLIGTEITLTIDRLAGLGEGCGLWEGHKVFIPHTLAGDKVRAVITQETSDFLRAKLISVEAPADDRIPASCSHFGQCGGCSLQHLSPAGYSVYKQQMVQEAVRKAGYEGIIPDLLLEIGPESRRRVDFAVTEENGEVKLGYKEGRSHAVVDITECRVLVPQLQQLIHPLKAALKKLKLASKLEAVHALYLNGLLDVGIVLKDSKDTSVNQPLVALGNALGATRLSVYRDQAPEVLMEKRNIARIVDAMTIDIPPFSFLQASQVAESRMVTEVMQGMRGCRQIADLFCGMGTFSIPLTLHAQVAAYDVVTWMTESLQHSAKRNGLSRKLKAERRDLFRVPLTAQELSIYDGIVINPPREGAKAQCEEIAPTSGKKLVMLSCNPATFARDARILRDGGWELKQIGGIDQFVYTQHLELVAHFAKA